MEFDEEQEQEIGVAGAENYQTGNNTGREEGVSTTSIVRKSNVRYRECLKNHAVGIGGHALDGCGEFMPAGEEGTMDALKCAACNCHRNFHRKEAEGEVFHHTPPPHLTHHHHHHPQFSPFSSYRTTHHPSGYLHVNPPLHQRPLALPSTSRDDEDMSNPSSSGGGGGGGSGGLGDSRKRFRTKFTGDQKDKMLAFAERLGWRMQKQDEALVQQFCAETNVKRHVFKVWMHNNKHTLGKKP
ncbi:zinc-finger homeodomain protein 2-like [Solanum dulcamara]|uniref:zinc-finger homeodomain protein 2-like n=1 Tax=Solanum dulcamara TaxID=45834 RepID=UPI002486AA71|nr:zinc-finger homeodomain protein 2-like [Solanum dulcamara]